MSTNTDANALRERLEALVANAAAAEEKAAAARCRVQATRQLLDEEQATAADLERKATAATQLLLSSSSSSSGITTDTPSYEESVITGLHVQAASIPNIRSLVNIVLEPTSGNFAH